MIEAFRRLLQRPTGVQKPPERPRRLQKTSRFFESFQKAPRASQKFPERSQRPGRCQKRPGARYSSTLPRGGITSRKTGRASSMKSGTAHKTVVFVEWGACFCSKSLPVKLQSAMRCKSAVFCFHRSSVSKCSRIFDITKIVFRETLTLRK